MERHLIALERLKPEWRARGKHALRLVERRLIALERLKRCRFSAPPSEKDCGKASYRVGAFEAQNKFALKRCRMLVERHLIALERLKLGQCQPVRLCAFKVGRSVSAFERSKFLSQRGKSAAAHSLEPSSIALELSKPWYQSLPLGQRGIGKAVIALEHLKKICQTHKPTILRYGSR